MRIETVTPATFELVLPLIADYQRFYGDAIVRNANSSLGFDAVKHLVLCRVERRVPRLDMAIYPYLPRASVETTSARSYMRLLTGGAAA